VPADRVSSDATAGLDEDKGLKILAREVTNIAAQIVPPSQANWLWDCTTPDMALAGSSVSAGAIAFSRKTAAPKVLLSISPCETVALPVAHRRNGFDGRRDTGRY